MTITKFLLQQQYMSIICIPCTCNRTSPPWKCKPKEHTHTLALWCQVRQNYGELVKVDNRPTAPHVMTADVAGFALLRPMPDDPEPWNHWEQAKRHKQSILHQTYKTWRAYINLEPSRMKTRALPREILSRGKPRGISTRGKPPGSYVYYGSVTECHPGLPCLHV